MIRIIAALTLVICVGCDKPGTDPVDPGNPINPAPTQSQVAKDSAFVATLRAHLDAATAADQFSGAVLIIRDGSTLFEGAYGRADRERGVANTLQTQFRIGSMNKMITAVSALQLVQEGKLSVNAMLGSYLPDYPNADLASRVAIHHLLTHTGGTGDIFGAQFMANRSELRNIEDYLKLYGTRGVQFNPGSQWVYSNYGFVLLGAAIERISGMSYDAYVASRVFAPAGMTATAALPEDSLVPQRAVGYTGSSGQLVSNAATLPYRGTPAGGGYSTVADMARFADAIQEHRLLNAAHTTMLVGGKVAMPMPGGLQYAYGFSDRVVAGRRIVGHPGGAAGMNGELAFEPKVGGYVVVVLSNFDPPAAQNMSTFILERLP